MKSIFKKASQVIIEAIKKSYPNLLSISDYCYQYWYTLEVNGQSSLFQDFESAVSNLHRHIRFAGLDHIQLYLHSIKIDNTEDSILDTVTLMPNIQDSYSLLKNTIFPIALKTIGKIEFANGQCVPSLSENSDQYLNDVLFIFFMDLPAYASDSFAGYVTRRSLSAYFGNDETKTYKSFLADSFNPPASLIGIQSLN